MRTMPRPSLSVKRYKGGKGRMHRTEWQRRKLAILAYRIEKGIDIPSELAIMGVINTGEWYWLQKMLKKVF